MTKKLNVKENIEMNRIANELREIPDEERTLKTLKDLKVLSKNPMFNIGADEQSNWIKLEAVKWYKYFQENYEREDFTDFGGELSSWIKHFFNLTEADLK